MRLRKAVVGILYEIASAACQLADSLSPSTDEIWRERRWREYRRDRAKFHDGLPLVDVHLLSDCDCDMGVGSNPRCLVHGSHNG